MVKLSSAAKKASIKSIKRENISSYFVMILSFLQDFCSTKPVFQFVTLGYPDDVPDYLNILNSLQLPKFMFNFSTIAF